MAGMGIMPFFFQYLHMPAIMSPPLWSSRTRHTKTFSG